MRDVFSDCHPLINLIYFMLIFAFAMVFDNPVCLGVSLSASIAFAVKINGRRAVKLMLCGMLPVFIFTAVLNPAFSHAGVTILTYLPDGNPLTLESIYYGLGAGVRFAAVLCWCSCFNNVMSSDKFVYLFGRIIPGLSLILSMTLRLVPRLKAQLKVITNAQRTIGRDVSCGSLLSRMRNGIAILSILVTWALENAMDTSDSMRSRAYGLPGRTAFSIYRFDKRDIYLMLWMLACGIYIISGAVSGGIYWQYYPITKGSITGWYSLSIFVVYALLCLTPVVLNICEELQWKTIQSEI